jgi:hypothetical protein
VRHPGVEPWTMPRGVFIGILGRMTMRRPPKGSAFPEVTPVASSMLDYPADAQIYTRRTNLASFLSSRAAPMSPGCLGNGFSDLLYVSWPLDLRCNSL